MMLLSIDRANGTLSLVSIPRDTLVFCEYAIPKINSAYGWGGGGEDGMRELMLRVSEIIGFEPDGYVLIGLEGFETLIDAMGGVEFNVPIDMRYSDPTQGLEIDLRAGEQRLSGSDAMQLVRFRSGYAMADLDRVTVQRAFVKAALSQWLSPEKLLRLPSALNTLKSTLQSDLPTENYLWLAESAMFCLESVRMETLPARPSHRSGEAHHTMCARTRPVLQKRSTPAATPMSRASPFPTSASASDKRKTKDKLEASPTRRTADGGCFAMCILKSARAGFSPHLQLPLSSSAS